MAIQMGDHSIRGLLPLAFKRIFYALPAAKADLMYCPKCGKRNGAELEIIGVGYHTSTGT